MRWNRKRSIFKNHSSSAIFEKWPFGISPYFSPFWQEKILTGENLAFFRYSYQEVFAYLCPNTINFDNVDFSEHRPEEVISFFWRSVYITWTALFRVLWILPCRNIWQLFIWKCWKYFRLSVVNAFSQYSKSSYTRDRIRNLNDHCT